MVIFNRDDSRRILRAELNIRDKWWCRVFIDEKKKRKKKGNLLQLEYVHNIPIVIPYGHHVHCFNSILQSQYGIQSTFKCFR